MPLFQGELNRTSIEPTSMALRSDNVALLQNTADSEPAAHSRISHWTAKSRSIIHCQLFFLGSWMAGHMILVAMDQVISPPPVVRTNSGSMRRAAKVSAWPLTMARRLLARMGHQSPSSSSR